MVKNGACDEICLSRSAGWAGHQASNEKLIGERAWRVTRPEKEASKWHAFDSAQPMHLRELAAETACLQKKLADLYPELVRVQRLAG